MKLTPWYFAAIAPIAVAGCSGTFLGHFAVLAVTLGIFFGTLVPRPPFGRARRPALRRASPDAGESASGARKRGSRATECSSFARMTVEAHEPTERLKRLDEFTLADLESVRLVLRGDSVIDWHRLNLTTDSEVEEFLRAQEFHPDEPADRARMAAIKNEAVSYLRRHFEYPIPKPVAEASSEEPHSSRLGRRTSTDVRLHDPEVHAHHPSPGGARAPLHAAVLRPGGLPPRRGEDLPRHREHARAWVSDHGVHRREEEQGLPLHEAPLEAGDGGRAESTTSSASGS